MKSFNFKMVLNNVNQLKHIQITKHMQYCIQNIYHVYYATQWNFISFEELSHMTVTSSKQNEWGC